MIRSVFELSKETCAHADLCIVMGSSMRLRHASAMPEACAENGGRLVIINLQKTPIDEHATL